MSIPNYWIKGKITGESDCAPASLLNAFRHFGMDALLDDLKLATKWEHGTGGNFNDAYEFLWSNGLYVDKCGWYKIEWPEGYRCCARDYGITIKNAAYMLDVYKKRFENGFIAVVGEWWNGNLHACLNTGYKNGKFIRVCHITGITELEPEEWWWMDPNRYLLQAPDLWIRLR